MLRLERGFPHTLKRNWCPVFPGKSVRNAKHFFSLMDMLRLLNNLMVNSRTWFIPDLVSASSIKSSAKAMEFILWVLSETPSWADNSWSNSSTIRLKIKGESGSPCLTLRRSFIPFKTFFSVYVYVSSRWQYNKRGFQLSDETSINSSTMKTNQSLIYFRSGVTDSYVFA